MSNNTYGIVYGPDNIYTDVSNSLKVLKDMQQIMDITKLELDIILVIIVQLLL